MIYYILLIARHDLSKQKQKGFWDRFTNMFRTTQKSSYKKEITINGKKYTEWYEQKADLETKKYNFEGIDIIFYEGKLEKKGSGIERKEIKYQPKEGINIENLNRNMKNTIGDFLKKLGIMMEYEINIQVDIKDNKVKTIYLPMSSLHQIPHSKKSNCYGCGHHVN